MKRNPKLYKTYVVRSPLGTHFRVASCEEYNCPAHSGGWTIRLEGLNPKLAYVARNSGRRYKEMEVAPGESYLVYEPGQQCFETHRLPLDRPQWFFAGRGTRDTFRPSKVHQLSAEDFVDDWMTNAEANKLILERG